VLQVYEEHGEAFRQSQEFYLIEVLVETREEADALRVRLEGGEHLHTLAIGHSIRPGAAEDSGVLHLQGRDRYARPDLYNAAKEAELEEIVGPVQGKEGYSLFKVFAREGGEIAPFAEVEKKARSFAHLGTKQRLFEEFVDALHEKYRDRITVYSDKLEQALPEAFLKQHKALEPAGDK
jgi:parvulin-like peptidyl-prolyl isomerase